MSRFTPVTLLPLILTTLLLTSCSGPDSSGGVEFSKTGNAFPYGDCRGSGYQTHHTEKTGCGWITVNEKSYYIMPWADLIDENPGFTNLSYTNLGHANLNDAYLVDANLRNADLYGADLSGADLSGVLANSSTICPNGINWGTSGNDCPF